MRYDVSIIDEYNHEMSFKNLVYSNMQVLLIAAVHENYEVHVKQHKIVR